VRLPLGVHQQTGQRYPFLDRAGRACHRLTPEDGLAWFLGQQHNTAQQLRIAFGILARALEADEPDPLPAWQHPGHGLSHQDAGWNALVSG